MRAGSESTQRAGSFPDDMRHGRFPYEVRGSTRAAIVVHEPPRLNLVGAVTNPASNQALTDSVRTAYGEAFRAGAPQMIHEMSPIVPPKPHYNNIGVVLTRASTNVPVIAQSGYGGILPLSQQPFVNKPLPYL